jgi:hypothetical protein
MIFKDLYKMLSILPDYQIVIINGDTILSVAKKRKLLITKVLQV